MPDTPNVGLEVPDLNSSQWGTKLNFNWNLLDTLLGGSQKFPTGVFQQSVDPSGPSGGTYLIVSTANPASPTLWIFSGGVWIKVNTPGTWGAISGILANQTDLVAALAGKAPTSGIDATAIGAGDVSSARFSYLNSLTGNVQSQINSIPVPTIYPTGLISLYAMTDGSGSTLTDSSGNGNNATLASAGAAPTWVTGGLHFANTQFVSLPSAVNTARTIQIFAVPDVPVYPPLTAQPDNVTILQGSVAQSIALRMSRFTGDKGYGGTPCMGRTDALQQICSATNVAGPHLVSWVISAGVSKIYVDGNEVVYTTHGSMSSSLTLIQGGVWQLGGSAIGVNEYYFGTVFYALFYSTELTPEQIAQNYTAVAAILEKRGVQLNYTLGSSVSNQAVFVGDSITYGQGATAGFPSLISTISTYTVTNKGIPSIWAQQWRPYLPFTVDPLYGGGAAQNIVFVFLGTNDTALGNVAADQILGNLSGIANERRQKGWKVIVATMLSRTGADAKKNTLNTLIRQYWSSFADALCDFAADPLLGADGASASATYFQVDHVHPTDAGQALLATHAQQTINSLYYLNGKTPTPVTTATYTELDADIVVVYSGASTSTITLVAATSQTGQVRTIVNASASGVTVAPSGSETITGSTSIAAGTTAKFQATLVSASAGGAYWLRIQ